MFLKLGLHKEQSLAACYSQTLLPADPPPPPHYRIQEKTIDAHTGFRNQKTINQ